MNIMNYCKYAAGLVISGAALDHLHHNRLHSEVLQCMQANQWAIVVKGGIDNSKDYANKYHFTVVKVSKKTPIPIGSLTCIYRNNALQNPLALSYKLHTKGAEDIAPIARYLTYKETPVWHILGAHFGHYYKDTTLRMINKATENLPVYTPANDRSTAPFSTRFIKEIIENDHVVRKF